jgi:tetratricopeptide (TPR) repeat protein
MKARRVVFAGLAVLALAAVGLFGGLITASDTAGSAARPKAERARSLTLLGFKYQSLARTTADLGYYERSEAVLRRALRLDPRSHLATTGLAALAASRHRFDEALPLARRAVALSPSSAAPYGILGDANLELGRYPEAFAAFDRMAALKPSASSYARVSYGRELLGDTAGALEAMRLAVEAAEPAPESVAWALTNLGNLHLGTGRIEAATKRYREALVRRPEYASALAGLARVNMYRGDDAAAAALYRRALAAVPLPEYAAALGDAYDTLGREAAAETAWARADALESDFVRHGGRNELETALFDLDHDRDVAGALERARAGWKRRPSVEGEHVLAWALYKNGRCVEAQAHSKRALRLGTNDVGALMHRSLIERCLGNPDATRAFRARALSVNPYARFEIGSTKTPLAASSSGRSGFARSAV